MDKVKVAAVMDWPTPRTVKNLQHFLHFANFCQRFIPGFRFIVNSLTALIKKGPKHLSWNPATDKAFAKLKTTFTTAPIFKHPDTSEPFMVKVHASESGVGEVFSQHFGEKSKLHPVAIVSRKLTPAEKKL